MRKEKNWKYGRKIVLFVAGSVFGVFIDSVRRDLNHVIDFFSDSRAKGVLDWFYEIAMIISLVSIIIMFRQFKGEHEKGRREKAIDLSLTWNNSINENTNKIKDFCEQLSDEQCRKLARYESFEIKREEYRNLKQLLPQDNTLHSKAKPEEKTSGNTGNTSDNDENTALQPQEIKQLRYEIVHYLNLLEIIMTAWKDNVADNEIIESEFSFLLNETEGKTLLENMRRALGNDSYPSISVFCATMQQKQQQRLSEKKEKI